MSNGIQLPPMPEKSRRHPVRTFALTAVSLGVLLGGTYYWKQYNDSQAPVWQAHSTPVNAMVVEPQDLPHHLEAVGSLKAVQQVTLSPETAGRIAYLHFESGQHVKANTLLAQLYAGQEQASLLSAQAKFNYAEHQLKRAKKLVKTGAESIDVLQERQSAFDQAQSDVQFAQSQLRQKQIIAPFSGELGVKKINLGQYVNPGEAAVTLTNLDKLHVEFTLPQQNLAALNMGGKVTFTTDAYPDHTFTATVNAIEPQVDRNTRNILIQGTLDNPDHTLRPGMYGKAELALPPTPNTIVLPETAVQISAQGYSVTVIRGENAKEKGKADIISVQVGKRIDNAIQITDGLKAGDVVVLVGQNRVQPGAEVTVKTLEHGE